MINGYNMDAERSMHGSVCSNSFYVRVLNISASTLSTS